MSDIRSRLGSLRSTRFAPASPKPPRATAVARPTSIALVAVSKTHPATRIVELLEQRAAPLRREPGTGGDGEVPRAARRDYPDLRLHLIGPLQTNKALDAVRGFDVVESLDRPRLADALAGARRTREGRLPELLVQVNIGDEPQKAGIARAEAEAFIRACRGALRGTP